MTYESLELVQLGEAEVEIEIGPLSGREEDVFDKFPAGVAPYVEFDE